MENPDRFVFSSENVWWVGDVFFKAFSVPVVCGDHKFNSGICVVAVAWSATCDLPSDLYFSLFSIAGRSVIDG